MADFDFHVNGIEDGIIAALIGAVGGSDGYAKDIETYSGELDSETLRDYLDELMPRMPLFLVAYGDGKDVPHPATAPVAGAPRTFRHECSFLVFCCSDDARGERVRRRGAAGGVGVMRMLSDARAALGGVRFRDTSGEEPIVLNPEPLTVAGTGDGRGVEFIARLPDLTAYAQRLDTAFYWTEADRRQPGVPVQQLFFDVTPTRAAGRPGARPGVVFAERNLP